MCGCLSLDVPGEHVTVVFFGYMALKARLLGFCVERIHLAPFVEVSEAPTSSRGIAAVVHDHPPPPDTTSLSAHSLFSHLELPHFFRQHFALLSDPPPPPFHGQF